jgi:ABC-type transport system involved in multi-copper enzyme maturation permease subunit
MDKLLAITFTAFQETLRRRVFYLVLLLALLVIVTIGSEMFYMRMARQAGEAEMIVQIGNYFMSTVIGVWDFAALFLAFFLGAIAVPSEISARTIVHVMSRPVKRWVYLLGRWLGILIFLWLFLSIGIVGALAISLWQHVAFAPTLWLAFAEMYVRATLYSGLALGLSVVTPPMLAGVLAFLLSLLPNIVGGLIKHPRPWYRIPALIGYYVGPARMPVNLVEESFAKDRLHADYSLYVRVLGENIFYVIAVLMVATFFFRRRELRVR